MTRRPIGVIGAHGDLGSQLVEQLRAAGFSVIECTHTHSNGETVQSTLDRCQIVHICAPLTVLDEIEAVPEATLIVLHDSVMSSSRRAAIQAKLADCAAIVHMLMNEQRTVVVADDAKHCDTIAAHFKAIGWHPGSMSIEAHDRLMSRSQAPLALLCQVLLPYLYEQRDAGMLTPSGQLLVETLHSRELAWTPETISSILANPQLPDLVDDMHAAITKLTT